MLVLQICGKLLSVCILLVLGKILSADQLSLPLKFQSLSKLCAMTFFFFSYLVFTGCIELRVVGGFMLIAI
jgi:hypothetical protein